jgi:demethylsterigmatocystin 6-O-methyltransferase
MEAIAKLAAEIQQSAAAADEAGRKEILNALRDLQYSIEKPEDTMQRVIHLVSYHYSSQHKVSRILTNCA